MCVSKKHMCYVLKWDQSREFSFWEKKPDKSSKQDEILAMDII